MGKNGPDSTVEGEKELTGRVTSFSQYGDPVFAHLMPPQESYWEGNEPNLPNPFGLDPASSSVTIDGKEVPYPVFQQSAAARKFQDNIDYWQKLQADHFEKFKMELRQGLPELQAIADSIDLFRLLADSLQNFHFWYLKGMNSPSNGLGEIKPVLTQPKEFPYQEFRANMLAAMEPLKKYQEVVATANAQMREALKACKPFDTDEHEAISDFLLG